MNRLAELRKEKNLTLKELGKKINMRDNTLSQYETGKRRPNVEKIRKLSTFFNVPPSYIQGFGWSRDETIDFLIGIYLNKFNDDFELPSGEFSYMGTVYKYGAEKDFLMDADDDEIPTFREAIYDYLLTDSSKVKQLKSAFARETFVIKSNEKDSDFFDSISDTDLEEFLNNTYIDEIISKYLNDEEYRKIRGEAIDMLDNDEINIVSLIEQLIPKEVLESVEGQKRSAMLLAEFEKDMKGKEINFKTIRDYYSEKDFKKIKETFLNNIEMLSDYYFLSELNTGIVTPEYKIGRKLKENIIKKNDKKLKENLSLNPKETITKKINKLDINDENKGTLTSIFDYLLNRIDNLENKIDELTNNETTSKRD